MPNWVRNRMTVKFEKDTFKATGNGMQILNFIMKPLCTEECVFDFEKLIPIPDSYYADYDPSKTLYPSSALSERALQDYSDYVGMGKMPENMDAERHKAMFTIGKQSYDNYQRYGAANWYDWCCKYWGTKWDACHAERTEREDCVEIIFDTAWSTPTGIWERLFKYLDNLLNAVSDSAAKPFVPMVLSALGGEFLVPERLRAECSDAVGSNLFMRTYERDEVLEEYILEEAEKFWKNHVEKHIPPSLENEKGANALATLNKYTQGFHAATPVMMPHEEQLADCYRQMTELSERKSALSKRSKELDAQIKKLSVPFVEALNGADRGQFFYDGSSYEVAYSGGERIGIPKKKYAVLRNAYPDAYDAVVEKSVTSPTLKVKKH